MPSLYFANPLFLLFLLLLPPLLWWQFRQRRSAVRFSGASLLQGLPAGRSKVARFTGIIVRTLALGLGIFALAGPRWPDEGSRIPTEGIAIAIVVDASFSMSEKDFLWETQLINRLDAVKKVFKLFVLGGEGPEGQSFTGRGHDLISLVVFAAYPETVCPLTLDHAVLTQLLEKQEPRPQEWTNIGDSIAFALNGLVKSGKGKKVMVLLTDGEQTEPKATLKPRQAAQLAGNLKIPIYVIDAGKDPAQLVDAKPEDITNRERAQKTMQDVAKITEGKYFQASDTKTLLEVCQQIDEMEREIIPSFQYRRYYEGFVWFALAALVLWFGITALELTFWRRVP